MSLVLVNNQRLLSKGVDHLQGFHRVHHSEISGVDDGQFITYPRVSFFFLVSALQWFNPERATL